MPSGLRWLNEPARWAEESGRLDFVTDDQTDFWRETRSGIIRDSGHLRYREVSGDFVATLEFSARYEALYDQAGMMLRLDDRNWIKAGIEFVEGRQFLSAVVTRDFSDWSTAPLPVDRDWIQLRCSREGSTVRIEWSDGARQAGMLRLAYFPKRDPVLVGPMCCSPQRAGLQASFREFRVEPAKPAG
jgi:regulation of enolase protein 1 (concanavalin A-like superfamily)